MMDISALYLIIAGVVAASLLQVVIGGVLAYVVLYVFFRLFRRRLSLKNYGKLIISIGFDLVDFFVVFEGFDLIWDGALGLLGVLFWGGRVGWLQFHELIPYPLDGFVPSLSVSGFLYILKYEKKA